MLVEPGIVDANVLVYATNADGPNHAVSRVLIDAARARSVRLYVNSQILSVSSFPSSPTGAVWPCHLLQKKLCGPFRTVGLAGYTCSAEPCFRGDSID